MIRKSVHQRAKGLIVSKANIEALNRYLTEQYSSVEGWCWEYNWQPIQFLAERQAELSSEVGPVAEIGVFHGKFFIGLALLKAGSSYSHTAIDVFDMQEFSLAGNGTRIRVPKELSDKQLSMFKHNASVAGIDVDRLSILRADSTNILSRDIEKSVDSFARYAFFSVDGCHEYTHAYNDLSIAMELTDHNGIIFVDDYMHARWPGVHEAVAKMMFCGAPRFVPLYYIHNKLAMCHVNLHNDYLEGLSKFLSERHPTTVARRVTRYGWQTLSIEVRTGTPVLAI